MATKGYKDNEQQTFEPNPTDWLGIQQGSLLSDMKKITYKDLTDPLQGQIDDHEQRVDDLELAEGSIKGVGWTNETVKGNADAIGELDGRLDTLEGTGYTEGSLKTHEDRLDTLEGEGEGSVAKAIDDAVSPIEENKADKATTYTKTEVDVTIDALDARLVDAEAHVYGLKFNETTGVSTRLLDAVGKNISAPDGTQAIISDFDNLYPWSAMKHLKVNMHGLEKEQDAHDYASFDGEVMTRIPEFWYLDYRKDGHRFMYISDKKKQGFLYSPERKIASFPASKVGTEFRSRVGEAPQTNTSYDAFLEGFYAQGDGKWSMYDCLHPLFLLTVIEAGHLNHKTAYGAGINSGMPYSSSESYKLTVATVDDNTLVLADAGQPFHVGMTIQVGTTYTNNSIAQNRVIIDVTRLAGVLTITVDGAPFSAPVGSGVVSWGQPVPQDIFDIIGDGSGYIAQYGNQNMSHVCYRGIWDLWGNVWQFYAGFMRYDGRYYGCIDPTKYRVTDPRSAEGWVDLGIGDYSANGYQQIREGIQLDGQMIDVPILWGSVASSETFYSAYLYYFDATYSGCRVLMLGGAWLNGRDVSFVYSRGSYSPFHSDVYFGSRLIRFCSQGS